MVESIIFFNKERITPFLYWSRIFNGYVKALSYLRMGRKAEDKKMR
jgi:hypothetical protein